MPSRCRLLYGPHLRWLTEMSAAMATGSFSKHGIDLLVSIGRCVVHNVQRVTSGWKPSDVYSQEHVPSFHRLQMVCSIVITPYG